jgi:hypothetical protein
MSLFYRSLIQLVEGDVLLVNYWELHAVDCKLMNEFKSFSGIIGMYNLSLLTIGGKKC